MYNMKKSLLAMLMAVLVLATGLLPAYAEDIPYDAYNYDYWSDIFRTPAAYVPKGTVLGTDLNWNGENLGAFVEPQDMFVAPDGGVYVADTNNHRIVVLENDLRTVRNVITGFDNAGLQDQFNKPTGIAVTEDGTLYIADSMNRRIVVLDAEGKLLKIVEIPAAAASQAIGAVTYQVGTHIDGMSPLAKTAETADATYAIVNLPEGSAGEVTDENGLTYTVVAVADVLQPFSAKAALNGQEYEALASGKAVLRMPEGFQMPTATPEATATPKPELAEGETAPTATPKASATPMPEGVKAFVNYDPVPNKDIFLMIGNLVNLIKGTPASRTALEGVKSLWVEEDGCFYAVSDKRATKLDPNGNLRRVFSSYKDAAGAQNTFTAITEFAVEEDLLYIRDGANKIVVLDQAGDLVKVIASNAVQVKDADGNIVATLTGPDAETDFVDITGLDLVGDKLLVGQKDGTVVVTNAEGVCIDKVENDTVIAMDAQGAITAKLTTAQIGKTAERFTDLTGVALLEDKLCVAGANNRIIVLNEDGTAAHVAQNNCMQVVSGGEVTQVVTGYEFGGEKVTFDAVGGVEGVALNYVCDGTKKANQRVQRQVCIADSKDNLIVFNGDMQVTRVSKDADSEALEEGYVFTPMKVAVDYAGRIYCVAQYMFEGIMVFETNGDFTGFFGTIQVSISAWDKFWRKLATKEERSKQQLFIPTEFTGIDIDEEGFVYASNVDNAGTQAVRRLNPKGEDVIRMGLNANLGGDIAINGTSQYAGPSKIVDVVYRDKGVYSLLDSKRGRVFTYDHEGNLLYIFGGLGTQEGTLNLPVAIEYAQDRLLVLDSRQNSILIFGETEYGRLINDAVALRFDGDEALAVELWEEVLRLDENNELANTGIGKAYLSAGDNEKAMEYLKRGMNKEYYSVAFKRYRNELLKSNIQYVLTAVVVAVVALVVYFKVIKPKVDAKRGRRA
ncbi:MAG: SMP-30/gluconolactonase/LRE family protein [Clostridia bacterium]|nr:SMP-30/gluconolactonase/LRE family protein [Clostridia bacterium]